ncbi:uncharacterized protein LOC133986241 [Scomber scombrus]|uniref:uncharacterized protein LOC133986241 n=1 Tax=Scomber scombrus TaxID=13677 RepID=UPI002DDA1330|nr:uncharacterized protein LOC133986241 [Scomber scombrus]
MIVGLTALILLTAESLIQTAEIPHLISLTVVEVGDNVTFHCTVSEKDNFHWYKQSLGEMGQSVASVLNNQITVNDRFKESRFNITKERAHSSLIIRNVSKEDEATYFCQKGASYLPTFFNSTFLVVNDNKQQKSVFVKQSPETASVQLGDALTFQCSLLSKNTTKNTDQCPGERSVYWFRAGSGGFHPGVIYIHGNRSDEQEERSCVYSLSKTIQDSDTGTHYCAVVTCGQVLFGEGTKVDTNFLIQRSELEPVVFALGALLACCVAVIAVLIFYVKGRGVCEHCKGATGTSHTLGHDKTTADQANDLDGKAEAVNYAALDFSTAKMKRGNKKRREYKQDCVYSVVRSDYHNQ